MDNIPKTMQYFIEAETAAAEVLNFKELIIGLHKKMNETREALSILTKGNQQSGYMYQGGILVKHSREEMIAKLKKHFKTLNDDIKRSGDELKMRVRFLQDIEQMTPIPGLQLVPLDRAELQALSQLWGGSN